MKTSQKIKIFIVDDHPLIRQALQTSILTEEDMEVIGTAANGTEAIEVIPTISPDLVLMDLMMPNMDGFEAIQVISKLCPEMPILALSSLTDEKNIFRAVQIGARGYLTKDVEHGKMVTAIRAVSAGNYFLPSGILEKVMQGLRQSLAKKKNSPGIDSLTKREKEILQLLGEGYSNKKISAILVLAEPTVRVHLRNIMIKINFENRRELVILASQRATEERINNLESV